MRLSLLPTVVQDGSSDHMVCVCVCVCECVCVHAHTYILMYIHGDSDYVICTRSLVAEAVTDPKQKVASNTM